MIGWRDNLGDFMFVFLPLLKLGSLPPFGFSLAYKTKEPSSITESSYPYSFYYRSSGATGVGRSRV